MSEIIEPVFGSNNISATNVDSVDILELQLVLKSALVLVGLSTEETCSVFSDESEFKS